MATFADGTLLVSDYNHGRLVLFNGDGRFIGVIGRAGTGPGEFLQPWGVAIDDAGLMYVSEFRGSRIQILRRV